MDKWTREAERIIKNGQCQFRTATGYAEGAKASCVDPLLADANRGAEAEKFEKAAREMVAAIEGHLPERKPRRSSAGNWIAEHQALLDAAKLCPSAEDDEKNARIKAVEERIEGIRADLTTAQNDLERIRG